MKKKNKKKGNSLIQKLLIFLVILEKGYINNDNFCMFPYLCVKAY